MSLDIDLTANGCEHCGRSDEVFDANITHNLGRMAEEAGLYKVLWRAEENDIEEAWQLILPLIAGIDDMVARPDHYKQFNSENGWGTYKHFLPWLQKLHAACEEWPEAKVRTSR